MKRKSTAFILMTVLILSFVLAGCTNPLQKDPKVLFAEATKNMNELDSMETKTSMNMSFSYAGMSMDITADVDSKMQNIQKSDETIMESQVSVSGVGNSMTMQEYFSDGYVYISADGSKVKQQMDFDQAKGIAGNGTFAADALRSVDVSTKDGETILDYEMDGDKITESIREMLSSYMQGSIEALGDIDITCGDATGTVKINRNTMITYQSVDTTVKASVSGVSVEIPLQLEVTYVDPGKDVKVSLPDDLDEYEETDDFND